MALNKMTRGEKGFQVFAVISLTLLMIAAFYPLLYVVLASFSEPSRFISHSGILLKPLGFTLVAYERAFTHPLIMSGYGNTLFVLIIGTTLSVVLTSLGAYFLSRKNVLLKRPIAFLIVFTMFFSGGMIPFYFVVKNLGIYLPTIQSTGIVFKKFTMFNSLWALIFPTAISSYNMIVLRSGFDGIPDSLEESARIDGAGHMTILFKIVLPLSKASLAVIVLYYGVGIWNGWFNASIFIQDTNKYPLQLALRQILLINDTNAMTTGVDAGDQLAISETIKYAIIVIATLPILCVYPFLQKYFVKGIMVGAVKG